MASLWIGTGKMCPGEEVRPGQRRAYSALSCGVYNTWNHPSEISQSCLVRARPETGDWRSEVIRISVKEQMRACRKCSGLSLELPRTRRPKTAPETRLLSSKHLFLSLNTFNFCSSQLSLIPLKSFHRECLLQRMSRDKLSFWHVYIWPSWLCCIFPASILFLLDGPT